MNEHDFGYNLKKILMERSMTQKSLAEAVNIDPVTLNRYVKGDRNIPLPTLKKIAEYLKLEPQNLLGTDDSDILIWHYHMLEGACIDIDKGIEQALEQGRNKSFIYPILRKYYTKQEMQNLVDSYDQTNCSETEKWPEDEKQPNSNNTQLAEIEEKLIALEEQVSKNTMTVTSAEPTKRPNSFDSANINLVPPESLFTGLSNVEDRQKLLDSYFKGISSCISGYNKNKS